MECADHATLKTPTRDTLKIFIAAPFSYCRSASLRDSLRREEVTLFVSHSGDFRPRLQSVPSLRDWSAILIQCVT